MIGCITQNRTIVVLDGSDKRFVFLVTNLVDIFAKELMCKAICSPLNSKEYPNAVVIQSPIKFRYWHIIQRDLHERYPGKCLFDPQM